MRTTRAAALLLLSVPALANSIDTRTIDKTVRTRRAQLKACYEHQLDVQPDLRGKLVVAFTVEPDGTVSTATITTSTLNQADVEACTLAEFRKLHFPRRPSDDGTFNVTYPLLFAPAD